MNSWMKESLRQSKSSDAIEKEINKILRESIDIDKHKDKIYGDSTPYRVPEELVDKKYRLEKIKAAKKKMDEEKLKKVTITDPDAKIMKHKDGSKKPSYILTWIPILLGTVISLVTHGIKYGTTMMNHLD